MNRIGEPPVSRNRICSGDCLSILKVSWKPLAPTSFTVTSTSDSASMTARGGVRGMNGPIIRFSWTLLSTRSSRHALRHGDVENGPRRLHQRVGPYGAVGVADQPEQQRVAEVFRGDEIDPVALPHRVLGHSGKIWRAWPRHEAARQIGDALPDRRHVAEGGRPNIAAVGRKADRRDDAELEQGSDRVVHGRPANPSTEIAAEV